MSTPQIPGRTAPAAPYSLAEVWKPPGGTWPAGELWPIEYLRRVDQEPTGWLIVAEDFFRDEAHGGTGCVLVATAQSRDAVKSAGWIGRELGAFGVWDSGEVDDGLAISDDGTACRFFVQVRRPSGAPRPNVDIALPFLWFWDAYSVSNGWRYVNEAGREQDLVRWELGDGYYRVEVRALEFRKYLDVIGCSAIVQMDYVLKAAAGEFERVDTVFDQPDNYFTFVATSDELMGDRPEFSRLLGQYVVSPVSGPRVPRWEEHARDVHYPEFIVGLDGKSGEHIRHTCNPDLLGTYFDQDASRLHYLTPVLFRPDVLQPYQAEPTRYRVSTTSIECLDLWSLQISINSANLVEVYLGDLGRDLPADEWPLWLAHNVPPEGTMEDGRFRRDFLGQFASSPDANRDLRMALDRANQASETLLGTPLWRAPDRALAQEFASMIGPLSDDPTALNQPVLTLAKILVDCLDTHLLRSTVQAERGQASLQMLRSLLEARGDTGDSSKPLRALQALRSRGGVAHVSNHDSESTYEALGIAGLRPRQAFVEITRQLVASLEGIARVLAEKD